MSERNNSGPKGSTAQFIKLKVNVNIGANINNITFDFLGIVISFITNFKPSANGCNNPQKPTTLGPFLL
jgi:hypothetical protein